MYGACTYSSYRCMHYLSYQRIGPLLGLKISNTQYRVDVALSPRPFLAFECTKLKTLDKA